MTDKEAIEVLKVAKAEVEWEYPLDYQIAFDKAIKALKQGDILDKIRDELKALSPEPIPYDVVEGDAIKDAVWEILTDVLEIIDKYRK